jgi:hypothetical protein
MDKGLFQVACDTLKKYFKEEFKQNSPVLLVLQLLHASGQSR